VRNDKVIEEVDNEKKIKDIEKESMEDGVFLKMIRNLYVSAGWKNPTILRYYRGCEILCGIKFFSVCNFCKISRM
jgi:hypothetical protein